MIESAKELIPEDKLPKPIRSIVFNVGKGLQDENVLSGEVTFLDGTVAGHSVYMFIEVEQADGSFKRNQQSYEECQLVFFKALTSPWAYETFEGMTRERYDYLNAQDEVKA